MRSPIPRRAAIAAIALGLVAAPLAIFPALPTLAQAPNVPADFRVRLVSSPLSPSPFDPPEWVEIAASGQTSYSAMSFRDQQLPAATANLPREAVSRIYKAVQDERFFDLQPLYRDDKVRDGDQAEMTVTAAGRTYKVRTVNLRVGAFDRVASAIDNELPPERRVRYNALRPEANYRNIER